MNYKIKLLPVLLAMLIISAKGFTQQYKPVARQVARSAAKQDTKIIFIEDAWKEALKQAALQNKYIFVDAYATWCGPCKMLKERTFTDPKVAEFYNKKFINISIDMEKGMGPQLARQWQMEAYPTLIIFNSKGKPVLGTQGFIGADVLLDFGKQALAKKI